MRADAKGQSSGKILCFFLFLVVGAIITLTSWALGADTLIL
jgi:hypothetical protein